MFSEKLAPQALESEQFVLGAMLLSPVGRYTCLRDLNEHDFHDTRHSQIFVAIRTLDDSNSIDVLQVYAHLKANRIDIDLPYLFSCQNACTAPSVPEAHIEIIRQKATLRRLIKELRESINLAEDESRPVEEVQSAIEGKVLGVREPPKEELSPEDWAEQVETESVLREAGHDSRRRIMTGYYHIDEFLRLYPKKLTVLAGRTSDGKTATALAIAMKSALALGQRTYIWSGEMDRAELWERMCASELDVPYGSIQDRRLTAQERTKVKAFASQVKDSPLIVRDRAMTIAEIRADCRYLTHTVGQIDLVVIDYLLLLKDLNAEAEGNDRRDVRIGIMVWNLIEMARELDCHVLLVHQMNRMVATRPTNRPMVSDLKESSAIEQHANNVLLVYRPERDDKLDADTVEAYKGMMELIIGKQRGGKTGNIWLELDADKQRLTTKQRPWPKAPEPPKNKR